MFEQGIACTEVINMYQQQCSAAGEQHPSRICRVCLSLVEDCMEINTVEELTGYMPYRDKLALVVPEMMLDMIQDPAICFECSDELQQAYKFKKKCMETEEKIRRLVQSYGGVIYSLDLSNIADRSKLKKKEGQPTATAAPPLPPLLPRPTKFPPAVILKITQQKQKPTPAVIKKIEPKQETIEADNKQTVEIVAITKNDGAIVAKETQDEITILPSVSGGGAAAAGEIEFHAVNELVDKNVIDVDGPLLLPKREEPIEVDEQSDPFCDINTLPSAIFEDKRNKLFRVVCNFCNKGFMGMFCLRNHQKVCGKLAHKVEADINIKTEVLQARSAAVDGRRTKRKHKINQLTASILKEKEKAKRITLPADAKNLLQVWLYTHRDNPYPTDVDKLKLVEQTNLSLVQVENWFINARRRILQKMLARGNKFEANLKPECSDEEWSLVS